MNHPRRGDRLERSAAIFFADAAEQGGIGTLSERIASHATRPLLDDLMRKPRANCRVLARIANSLLALEDRVHETLAELTELACRRSSANEVVADFVGELARKIPLGIDTPLELEAKRIRATGIFLCLLAEYDLASCACFRDLFESQTEDAVKALVAEEMRYG